MRAFFEDKEIPLHLKKFFEPAQNTHCCVKNRSLMRYFCKLITPPGGVVLDPFGGSGSTAIGAIEEGFNYLLIEKEEEYHAIALARIAAIQKSNNQLSLNVEL